DLLRSLAADRETARVVVSDEERDGELFIVNGELVHASFGELVGNDAMLSMLAAPWCEAEVQPGQTTSRRTDIDDLQSLLAEHEPLDEVYPAPMPAPRSPSRSTLIGVLALVLAMGVAIALVWAAQIVRGKNETVADAESTSAAETPDVAEITVVD